MTEASQPQIRMRSWLFAPGDSVKKMTKAAEGDADIVLFDLEDAVVESGKASAVSYTHLTLPTSDLV